MLWKDEYKIGVSLIDNQHKAMFDRVDLLLATLSKNNNDYTRTECINTIGYLKQYCVIHFRDEEIFQNNYKQFKITIDAKIKIKDMKKKKKKIIDFTFGPSS